MIDKNKLIELDKRKGALDEYVYVKHKKCGTEYRIEMFVKNTTNERYGEVLVIYSDENWDNTWARNIDEFCDGRFEIVK
ncbi:hypothetical protein I0618_002804 [Staphylococcus pseudintermedius]|nr:hypothetical protein [Staphylococcus pseudintermedius]EGQ3935449.1 hypothetical protein [Staphylococcus pseudintermedius]